ncbi:MAG: hypothetical protein C4554_08600 [Dethiobacter sp.]|jgi:Na+-transporting methylmalonyl-CoA/oxaloacetate decarboxylase gamma subunit|nr:MAG: hypothetical protein C4554_08600 [Dethiobacter sp.]
MHNLSYGLEMMAIGLLIVMTSLLLLALVLLAFNKIFYYKSNNKIQAKSTANNTVQTGRSGVQARPQAAPEIVCTTSDTAQTAVRAEIIAASMGALLFALDKQNSFAIGNNTPEPATNMWAQAGRTRVLNLRQDFVLLRRGKFR